MDYKNMIVEAGKRMLHSGLTVGTWGNISIRDPKTQKVYMTPSAINYDDCTADDVVVLDLKGNVIEGHRKPTIEKDLHLQIYNNKDVDTVIHTHPIDSMVFACTGETIPQITDEAAQTLGAPVKVADYALPGTLDLAANCVKALKGDAKACLLQSHGAVCIGGSIDQAFMVATVLEITAKIYYMTKQTGSFIPISDSNIAAMADFVKNHYGQNK